MLRSTPEWEEYERDCIRRSPRGYLNNVAIADEMVRHVERLGKSPLKADPYCGLEDEIRLAKALNVRLHLS